MSVSLSELAEKIKDFDRMIFEIASNHMFVNIDKHSLKYKNFLIKKENDTWVSYVFLKDKRMKISETFLKVSAISICKLYEKNRSHYIKNIVEKDKLFEKNYIDSIYYKNTYKKTKNIDLKYTSLWRYEISHGKAKIAKQYIDKEFYSLLR